MLSYRQNLFIIFEGRSKSIQAYQEKICYSHEIWHTFNLIFSDTKSILSFYIHSHWTVIQNLWWFWKQSSQNGLESDIRKGCCFIRKMLLHTSVVTMTAKSGEKGGWLTSLEPQSCTIPIATTNLCAVSFHWWSNTHGHIPGRTDIILFNSCFSKVASFKVLDYCPMWMYLNRSNVFSFKKI